jgi:four helix bundle protein
MLRIYEVMLDSIAMMVPLIQAIRRHDRDLADQTQSAANSAALNIAEGGGSWGGVRTARYRTALGSAREAVCGLQVAERARYIEPLPAQLVANMNHVIGTLVRVTQ